MTNDTDTPLVLDDFLPYRLSVVTNKISSTVARAYRDRFGLTIPEWRVMAVVGMTDGLSANAVAERTAMDKVRVSRAVARLLKAGLLDRRVDPRDRRRSELRLSADGRAVYGRIVPLARETERQLLDALSEDQRRALDDILRQLERHAERLISDDETKFGR